MLIAIIILLTTFSVLFIVRTIVKIKTKSEFHSKGIYTPEEVKIVSKLLTTDKRFKSFVFNKKAHRLPLAKMMNKRSKINKYEKAYL